METPDFFAIFETFDRAADSDAYAMSQNFQFLSSEDIFENTQFTDLTPSTAILESVPNLPEFAFNTNDNVTAIYHYSIPTSKLAYPEPFIASASFMHTDLWFIHILIYQYWLWFVFVFIIIFFLITFVCTVRWCNMRIRPRRETRGVSRSKCGDLITACVPVSWATSIIVNESTDAIDYYDGFGTTELVLGIRAYQWGWEYYYPQDLDLNYDLKTNYSTLIGKSLKYNKSAETNLTRNNMWKFYQSKNADLVNVPAKNLLTILDNENRLKIIDKSTAGSNLLTEAGAFKRARSFSKNIKNDLFTNAALDTSRLKAFNAVFNSNFKELASYAYGTRRQQSFLTATALPNGGPAYLNTTGSRTNVVNKSPYVDLIPKTSTTARTINYRQITNETLNASFWQSPLAQLFKNNLKTLATEVTSRKNLPNIHEISQNTNYTELLAKCDRDNSANFSSSFLISENAINGDFRESAQFNNSTRTRRFLSFNNNADNVFFKNSTEDTFSEKRYEKLNQLIFKKKIKNINYENIGQNFQKLNAMTSFFYWALPAFYNDYDFRNWQAATLLEDSLWESTYNSYYCDEYDALKNEFGSILRLNTLTAIFRKLDMPKFRKNVFLLKTPDTYSIYFANALVKNQLTAKNDHTNFGTITELNAIDDVAEEFKITGLNDWDFSQNNLQNIENWHSLSIATPFVLNSFQSDFEDTTRNVFKNENDARPTQFYSLDNTEAAAIERPLLDVSSRIGDFLHLRDSTKNSIANYNAIQKVFKPRFDEMRSHAKLSDLAATAQNQLILNSSRPRFEKFLGKNKQIFNQISVFNFNFKNFSSLTTQLNSVANVYTFDFPFWLGTKSDSAKHVWFDWFVKWGFYEVQPASSSRYAIHGMPYFNKTQFFNAGQNDILNETENYLIRIARARRNYVTTWIHTPILTNKSRYWNVLTDFWFFKNQDLSQLILSQCETDDFIREWETLSTPRDTIFASADSGVNSVAKSTWRGQTSSSKSYYENATFAEILNKREYLYRQILTNQNCVITSLNEIATRPNLELIKDAITVSKQSNSGKLTNSGETERTNTQFLFKNQYRPMRKGINNMLRLHASAAVALPIELRLQILASSRDVIHSWAVPSAGIKIDCVPGYSSHKVMIFLVSGIFWGQCMEVCGRYHHWMPIVVYFMKRDLFFLWCSHFVFNNKMRNGTTVNGKFFPTQVRPIAYSKKEWLLEL